MTPDPALRDRLMHIFSAAWHKSRTWTPAVIFPAGELTDALLASEEWLTLEGVVRAAKAEHAHCDGVGVDLDDDAAAPCFVCGALGRLAAVRGTT